MNYNASVTWLVWETRNWRHHAKVRSWCKDYGLRPVTKYLYVGELYAREKNEMEMKFKNLFTGKNEKFFFAVMCKSCSNENMHITNTNPEKITASHFDLIQ